MSDLIGKIICGYRIVSQIGEGGMGKVYLGESAFLTEYKQQVAIKTLSSRGSSERQAAIVRDLFIREANIQVQLKHQHIVSVIQFAVEGDEYFLILEYLPGYRFQGRKISNVADVIAHEMRAIPPPLAFQWFNQILDAMSYAHSFRYRWQGEDRGGIVHRDIKPANLLLLDPKTVKVSDFGIVKVSQHGGTVTRNLTPGTSAYMSPEAILGPAHFSLEQLDGRADVYSLGITLFEMLTGKLPFSPDEGTSVDGSLRRKQVEETPPAPSSILATLSPQIDALVLKALEKHPDKRYQSAAEFKKAVQDYEQTRLTVPIVGSKAGASPYETRPLASLEGTEVLLKQAPPTGRLEGTEVLQRDATSPQVVSFTQGDAGQRDSFLTTTGGPPAGGSSAGHLSGGASATGPSASAVDPRLVTTSGPGRRNYLWIIGVVGLLVAGGLVAIPAANWISSSLGPRPSASPGPSVLPSATVAPRVLPEGMVAIPGGAYLMGRNLTEEEKLLEVTRVDGRDKVFTYDYPAHIVEVKPFYIDRTEVSNRAFAEFVRSTGHAPPKHWKGEQPPADAENIPVTFVNFLDASDFCAWRSKERKDGFTYRVPSEEEWEFAARGPDAGKPGRLWLYPWGETWEEGRANTLESKLGYPQIVTSNPNGASAFGAVNMAGNVYEWTGTDFRHYPGSDQKTPRAKGFQGVYQVVRGGSFKYPKEYAMTTTRVWARPTDKGEMLGFRCAADGK